MLRKKSRRKFINKEIMKFPLIRDNRRNGEKTIVPRALIFNQGNVLVFEEMYPIVGSRIILVMENPRLIKIIDLSSMLNGEFI